MIISVHHGLLVYYLGVGRWFGAISSHAEHICSVILSDDSWYDSGIHGDQTGMDYIQGKLLNTCPIHVVSQNNFCLT